MAKFRSGFVSNSSSSSFVVGFDKKPESVDELKTVLFGDAEVYGSPYGNQTWSTQEVARIVWYDLNTQIPATEEKVHDELGSGYFKGRPEFPFHLSNQKGVWESYEQKVDQALDRCTQRVMKMLKGKKIFIFEYSDNDGDLQSAMEHGDLFDKLPHEVVSKH